MEYICTPREKTITSDYDIGVVYTSTGKEKSNILVYNDAGKLLDKSSLKVGGINLANFYKTAIHYNDKVYFTMPVLGNKSQDFIIQVNKNDLSYRKFHNPNKRGVTSFDVNKIDAFLSVSDLQMTDLTKANLLDDALNQQVVVEGSCKLTILEDERLYLFSNINESDMRVYEISIADLEIISQTDINDVTFVTDAIAVDNNLYFLVNHDKNDKLTN